MPVPNTQENISRCVCGSCPSYLEGGSGFFCSLSQSQKNPERKGCICNTCGNWGEFGLSTGYYCVEGKAE